MKKKLIRVTTIPLSLEKLLEGQMSFMNNYFEVTAVSSDKKKLEEVGDKEKVCVFYLELTRKITILKDLKAVFNFYKFLKKEKPFIVHSHTPKAGLVSMLASKLAGVPNRLHTVAGLPLLEATGFKRIILNKVEWLTYKCATKVYPNSFELKKIIIKENLAKEKKLKVIGYGSSNGINLEYFNSNKFLKEDITSKKTKLNIKQEDFVYIFVGRIVKDKGINELVESFKKINKKYNNTKLLLVGPFENDLDPISDKNQKEIKQNPNIIEVGYVEDVRPYFLMANVLVFPSYREGFPNVVMQAGAMGLPSIVSDINGCNEIIKNNINGIIVPVKNNTILQQSMEKLLLEKELYLKLKDNSRVQIESKYDQKFIWNEILEEYKNLDNV